MAAEEEKSNDFYSVLGLKKECTAAELRNVLSEANKRFLYDVGIYDCDDDDGENGMADFLNEMAVLMSQNKSNENGNDSFEELQELFDEIFHGDDIKDFGSSSRSVARRKCFSSQDACNETYNISNKRNSSSMSSANFSIGATGFCMGAGGTSRKHQRRKIMKKSKRRYKGWQETKDLV